MPKNKFQDAVFTLIMATVMIYGIGAIHFSYDIRKKG